MYSENDWSLPQSSIISACVNNSSHNFWRYSTSFNTIKSLQECFEQFSTMNEKNKIKLFDILKMTYLFDILIITRQTKNMALKDKEGWRILGKKQSASLQRAIKPKGRTCSPYWRWPRWRLMCALRSGIQVTFREELSNRKGCEGLS